MPEEVKAKSCPYCKSTAVKRVGHSVFKCLKCYKNFSGSVIEQMFREEVEEEVEE